MLLKIAISIGDINGIGPEIILKAHKKISKLCTPIYCVDKEILKKAAKLIRYKMPKDIKCQKIDKNIPTISPSTIDKDSGLYSYKSFKKSVALAKTKKVKAIITMPIHKKAWELANIKYKGHTDALRDYFKSEAIMILGSPRMFVALFSDHIPLRDVPNTINSESLSKFLINISSFVDKKCGVLGLNPHAGDFGVLGNEEKEIIKAIKIANTKLNKEVFQGPLVPDVAFNGKHLKYYVAMYHDQGLIPLKTLYFKESINITLNIPIIRTSVDHGCAFDIAYKNKAHIKSYINAVKMAVKMAHKE